MVYVVTLISCLIILLSCAHSPNTSVSESTKPTAPQSAFVGRWGNTSWSTALMQSIQDQGLTNLSPKDASEFHLNPRDPEDWARLFVEMAKWESNWNPKTTYKETTIFDAQGNNVISTGLFQISRESVNALGCKVTQADLLDGEKNIACAVKVFAHYVKRDGRIAGMVGGKWQGGAKYWAVLRGTKTYTAKAFAAIKAANK